MYISQFMTIWLIPLGLIFSFLNLLPISLPESIVGAVAGYGFLYGVTKIFYLCTGKQGMGEGDFELLALIGSFTGFIGSWFSLMCGSLIGSIAALLYILIKRPDNPRDVQIPFGPFLAIGAIIYVLTQEITTHILFGSY